MDGITDRWAVRDGDGRRYTKIYLLQDRRFGTRYGLGLIYKTQCMTKKTRRLRARHKLIEQLEGGRRGMDYVQTLPPDYVPKRRTRKENGRYGMGMRRRRYNKLRMRLLYPDRKSSREYERRTVDEINRLQETDPK